MLNSDICYCPRVQKNGDSDNDDEEVGSENAYLQELNSEKGSVNREQRTELKRERIKSAQLNNKRNPPDSIDQDEQGSGNNSRQNQRKPRAPSVYALSDEVSGHCLTLPLCMGFKICFLS